MRRPICLPAGIALALAIAVFAADAADAQSNSPARQGTEADAARAYQAAVNAGPQELHAFLVQFPKGADLHVHLSGAVYAETFIREAGEDGLCVDPVALRFANPPCTGS